jgi:spermidine/putrescine transport system ATP-binding protein
LLTTSARSILLRKAMQLELKCCRPPGLTFVYVTYDQEAPRCRTDRRDEPGHVRSCRRRKSTRIRHRFVADFIGETNFLTAASPRSEAARAALTDDLRPAPERHAPAAATVAVRPEVIRLPR